MSAPCLRPLAQCLVTDTHNAFGFMDQAGISGTDRLSDLGFSNAYEHKDVSYDPNVQALYAAPMFVPHHNLRTGRELTGYVYKNEDELQELIYLNESAMDGLPGYHKVRWTLLDKGTRTGVYTGIMAPLEYMGLRAELTQGKTRDPAALHVSAECTSLDDETLSIRGFYLFKRHSLGDDSSASADNRTMRITMYLSADLYWTLEYKGGHQIKLTEYRDGATKDVGYVQSPAALAEAVGHEKWDPEHTKNFLPVAHVDQAAAVVLLINNILQVWVHGKSEPFVIYADSAVKKFNKVKVDITGGKYVYWSLHPMCFHRDSYFTSNEHNLGFVRSWSTPITYKVLLADKSETIDAEASTDWEQGTEFRYRLDLTNPSAGIYKDVSYSHDTPAVRSVTYRVAPILLRRNDSVWECPIREAFIDIVFNWHDLTITSKATVIANNRHGEWANGWPYDFGHGNRAISLDLGWLDTNNGTSLTNRRFTGIGGMEMGYVRGVAPESVVRITCEDLSVMCREYPLVNAPWMDGWCHLYAMRFLLWTAGIPDDLILIEPCYDPFCSDPNHYHLPIGEGGRPQMYFAPQTYVWAAMLRIRELTGYVMYFDCQGYFHYYPWLRTAPGPFKRIFTDGALPISMNPYQNIQQMEFSRNTRTVRTGITVVGVDAYGPHWKPILAHRANNDAIYNKWAPNYVGYRKPAVWVDSRFATQEFADAAADAMNGVLSLPVDEMALQMVGMSDLFPLDVIAMAETKTPVGMRAFFITQTHEHIGAGKQTKDYSMTINGRWIV